MPLISTHWCLQTVCSFTEDHCLYHHVRWPPCPAACAVCHCPHEWQLHYSGKHGGMSVIPAVHPHINLLGIGNDLSRRHISWLNLLLMFLSGIQSFLLKIVVSLNFLLKWHLWQSLQWPMKWNCYISWSRTLLHISFLGIDILLPCWPWLRPTMAA